MEFSSPVFVSIFLPALLLARVVCRDRFRNAILLAASLAFCAWGSPQGVLLLVAVAAANFGLGLCLARASGRLRLLVCAVGIGADIAILCLHKYLPGCIGVAGLPLGLSFYIFQVISYLVDVCRGDIACERRFGTFLLYVSFFPKMVSGPIARYGTFPADFGSPAFALGDFVAGLERFALGFSKKVLLADVLAQSANVVFDAPVESVPCVYCWIGAVAYTLQIYFDFSGCTDMAVGLARAFGFRLPENFNYPYAATSVQDFWRRWHISLSTWFRDYVYIPLGGNRRGTARAYLNQCVVFLLCGAWHGASWTFVAWGAYHGLGLTAEKAGFRKVLDRLPRLLANAYVLLFALVGWVLFRSSGFGTAALFLKQMFLGNPAAPYWSFVPYYHVFDLTGTAAFLVGGLLAYPFVGTRFAWLRDGLRLFVVAVLFAVAFLFAMTGAFSPSIYGQF